MTDRANIERWQKNVKRASAPLIFAYAPSDEVYPHLVDHLFSMPIRGIRYYAFAWEGARQYFISNNPSALRCTDPFPKED